MPRFEAASTFLYQPFLTESAAASSAPDGCGSYVVIQNLMTKSRRLVLDRRYPLHGLSGACLRVGYQLQHVQARDAFLQILGVPVDFKANPSVLLGVPL